MPPEAFDGRWAHPAAAHGRRLDSAARQWGDWAGRNESRRWSEGGTATTWKEAHDAMASASEGLDVLFVGIVALLLGMTSGISVALHSYVLGVGALVLSLLGWGLTLKLATRF